MTLEDILDLCNSVFSRPVLASGNCDKVESAQHSIVALKDRQLRIPVIMPCKKI